jgi:hypothetical protein
MSFTQSYNISNISYINSPLYCSPSTLPLYCIIFAFTYMCTHFCTVFTLLPPFPASSPISLVPALPQAGSVPPSLWFSDFVEEKRENEKT